LEGNSIVPAEWPGIITALLSLGMLVRQVCVALAIVALAGAVPAPVKHVLHEKRSEHVDWVKGERIKRDSVLPVRIGLAQNNLERGDEYLMAV
jgi:tripeptidyl-peptidase-1